MCVDTQETVPALSCSTWMPGVMKSDPFPTGSLYSAFSELVLYAVVTLFHWSRYTACTRMARVKIPASEGFRSSGASKNWEKWMSCAKPEPPVAAQSRISKSFRIGDPGLFMVIVLRQHFLRNGWCRRFHKTPVPG